MGAALGLLAIVLERRIERISLKRLIGVVFGVTAGLICAALVSLVLGRVGGDASNVIHFAQIVCMLFFAYVGAVTGSAKGELLNLSVLGGLFGAEAETRSNQKILDTSVIIDGRIADIADTGFFDGILVVPAVRVARAPDGGRFGGFDEAQSRPPRPRYSAAHPENGACESADRERGFPAGARSGYEADRAGASLYNCKIITNDFNLNKVAHVRGVEVLNINELANSLKPIVLPGELMRVFILKEGKEYNQGVAYLDDGTMVVVDNARRMISKTIDISVTSVLQTTAGKMIFGKYDERNQAAAQSGRRATRPRPLTTSTLPAPRAGGRRKLIVKTAVILPAAGLGTRMQRGVPAVPAETTGTSRKQFMLLEGAPILVHTVRKFVASPLVTDIVVAVREEEIDWVEEMLHKEGRGLFGSLRVVAGRQHAAGIRGERRLRRSIPIPISSRCTMRCGRSWISKSSGKVIEEAAANGAAIVGIVPVDTVKQVSGAQAGGAKVRGTISRERLILAQTPQVFRYDVLRRAFEAARRDNFSGTDEASLVERLDQVEISVVLGSERNIKITRPSDMDLARLFFEQETARR